MINIEEPVYDVAVVGGAAAGLSAALVLGRARRRVTVVDAGAPRNAPAAHMQGFLSRDGMPPADLSAAGRVEVTGYGVELVEDQVVAIEGGFTVRVTQVRENRAYLTIGTGCTGGRHRSVYVAERLGRDLAAAGYPVRVSHRDHGLD